MCSYLPHELSCNAKNVESGKKKSVLSCKFFSTRRSEFVSLKLIFTSYENNLVHCGAARQRMLLALIHPPRREQHASALLALHFHSKCWDLGVEADKAVSRFPVLYVKVANFIAHSSTTLLAGVKAYERQALHNINIPSELITKWITGARGVPDCFPRVRVRVVVGCLSRGHHGRSLRNRLQSLEQGALENWRHYYN